MMNKDQKTVNEIIKSMELDTYGEKGLKEIIRQAVVEIVKLASQKRKPLSEKEIGDLWANQSPANEFECVRLVESELLQRILDTDPKFLGGRFIAEIQELLAQPEYKADRRSDPISKLRNLRDIQGRKGNYDVDEYMRGLYNGLELSLSIFEDRGPDYKEPIAQPEHLEDKLAMVEQEPVAWRKDKDV